MARLRLLLTLIPLAAGCVPDFHDEPALVLARRIVAVQSEPAEAKPDEAVQLRALVVDPNVAAAPAFPRFGLCLARKPLTELGPVSPACLDDPASDTEALVALGAGESVSARLPLEACRLFGPSRPEPKDGEAAGRAVDADPTGGYFQPVTAKLDAARELAVGSVRLSCALPAVTQAQALEFTRSYRVNQNPELSALSVLRGDDSTELTPEHRAADTAPTRVAPGERLTLRASWSECSEASTCGDGICGAGEDRASCVSDCSKPRGCTGAEFYAWFDPQSRAVSTRRESLVLSWFATGGELESPRTARDEADLASFSDNTWTAPLSEGEARLWVVLSDARGGQSWRSYRFRVAP